MAISVTSLTRNGLLDWLVQRVSAVLMTVYIAFLVVYFFTHPQVTFLQWHSLFTSFGMKFFSFLFLLSLCLHAWIGVWTVLTDYIKCAKLRLVFYVGSLLVLWGFLLWGIQILWSV